MKYFIMSRPEPSRKSLERRVDERVQAGREQAIKQGATSDEAATQAVVNYTKFMHEEVAQDNPTTFYGGNAHRRLAMLQRQIYRRHARGF
jgi:hypothetical protein